MGEKPEDEAQQIIDTIKDYIQEKGGDYNAWNAAYLISLGTPYIFHLTGII